MSNKIILLFVLTETVFGSTLLNTKDRVLGSQQDLKNKALIKWISIVVGILFVITMVFVCLYVRRKHIRRFMTRKFALQDLVLQDLL